ncbi:Uncharacterised protein [Bordetella pertussis]|nr:Uncharacterised protein [Bordetella pertussis]
MLQNAPYPSMCAALRMFMTAAPVASSCSCSGMRVLSCEIFCATAMNSGTPAAHSRTDFSFSGVMRLSPLRLTASIARSASRPMASPRISTNRHGRSAPWSGALMAACRICSSSSCLGAGARRNFIERRDVSACKGDTVIGAENLDEKKTYSHHSPAQGAGRPIPGRAPRASPR